MENARLLNEVQYRHQQTIFLEAQAKSQEPLDLTTQNLLARHAFDSWCHASFQSETAASRDITDTLSRLIPTLRPEYQWLAHCETEQIQQVLDNIDVFTASYYTKHGKQPLSGRIYREFRMQLEQASEAQDDDQHMTVVILEALMNGDIIKGEIPSFR